MEVGICLAFYCVAPIGHRLIDWKKLSFPRVTSKKNDLKS